MNKKSANTLTFASYLLPGHLIPFRADTGIIAIV